MSKKENPDISKVYTAINNIPNCFVETIKNIKCSFENYLETLTRIQAIENEEFYKAGFSDAIKLFLEMLKEPRTKK